MLQIVRYLKNKRSIKVDHSDYYTQLGYLDGIAGLTNSNQKNS